MNLVYELDVNLMILSLLAVRIEQKQYEKCVEDCEKAVEVGRENKTDFKLIGK